MAAPVLQPACPVRCKALKEQPPPHHTHQSCVGTLPRRHAALLQTAAQRPAGACCRTGSKSSRHDLSQAQVMQRCHWRRHFLNGAILQPACCFCCVWSSLLCFSSSCVHLFGSSYCVPSKGCDTIFIRFMCSWNLQQRREAGRGVAKRCVWGWPARLLAKNAASGMVHGQRPFFPLAAKGRPRFDCRLMLHRSAAQRITARRSVHPHLKLKAWPRSLPKSTSKAGFTSTYPTPRPSSRHAARSRVDLPPPGGPVTT